MKRSLIPFLMLMLIFSCNRKMDLAKKCAELFPPRDSVRIDTIVATDTLIIPDTWIEVIDTTDCPPSDTATVKIKTILVPVPGDTIRIEIPVIDTNIIFMPDSAMIWYLESQITKLKKENTKLESKLGNRWPVWILVAILPIATGLGMLFRTKKKKTG